MRKVWIALLAVLLALVLAVGGYAAYVFIDYHRLEDDLPLEVVQRAEGALPVGEELTVATWNVGFGAYSADYSFFMDGGKESRARSKEAARDNVLAAAERLREMQPDLVLAQEVDIDSTRSYHVDQRALIEESFPGHSAVFAQNYDSSYLFYPLTEPIGASKSGILTLSNARIEGSVRRSLPVEAGFRKLLDLDRCYDVSRIPLSDGGELCLFNLHLSAYTADGGIATEQLRILLAEMAAERAAGRYVIAGGDFNKDVWGDTSAVTGISGADYSWAQPFPTELLPEGFTLVDSLNPEDPVPSCRDTGAPYEKGVTYEVTLDGFIVSDNVEVTGCEVIDTGFATTDHNPVRMTFRLRES